MGSQTNDFITIVSGLPRSGTSVMMQMIDKGGLSALTDNARTADEDNPKGYYEFEPVKKTKEDPSWLQQAEGKVVKMVHLLLMDLPLDREYRVVFMRRKLEEVVASQNVMLERSGKPTGNLSGGRIMEIFQAQIDKVINWLEEHSNFKVLEVNHSDVINDPKAVAQAVNEFLGGTLDAQAMQAVVDPALYRQRM